MKKKYQAPQVEVIILETHNPILNGSVTVSGLSGIEGSAVPGRAGAAVPVSLQFPWGFSSQLQKGILRFLLFWWPFIFRIAAPLSVSACQGAARAVYIGPG